MGYTETVTFEIFRLIALSLIYIGFALQIFSIRFMYRQIRAWELDEHARRERWTQDMEAVTKAHQAATRQLEEAGHLRIQAEIALAQARRHLPGTRPESNLNGAFPNRGYERTES